MFYSDGKELTKKEAKFSIHHIRPPNDCVIMPAEAIMAAANTSTLNYQNSAVFDPESPPSQVKQRSNDKDFFESLAAEKPTHLEYLKNFR